MSETSPYGDPTEPSPSHNSGDYTGMAPLPPLQQQPHPGYGTTPAPGGYGPGPKPDNYLAWSIVATILCCWPVGIPAIVYAAKVDSLWNQGRYSEAKAASDSARTWTIAAASLGAVVVVLYGLAVLLGAAAGTS